MVCAINIQVHAEEARREASQRQATTRRIASQDDMSRRLRAIRPIHPCPLDRSNRIFERSRRAIFWGESIVNGEYWQACTRGNP